MRRLWIKVRTFLKRIVLLWSIQQSQTQSLQRERVREVSHRTMQRGVFTCGGGGGVGGGGGQNGHFLHLCSPRHWENVDQRLWKFATNSSLPPHYTQQPTLPTPTPQSTIHNPQPTPIPTPQQVLTEILPPVGHHCPTRGDGRMQLAILVSLISCCEPPEGPMR